MYAQHDVVTLGFSMRSKHKVADMHKEQQPLIGGSHSLLYIAIQVICRKLSAMMAWFPATVPTGETCTCYAILTAWSAAAATASICLTGICQPLLLLTAGL
jgi:hypothetical protein